jgi:hypothetical protein
MQGNPILIPSLLGASALFWAGLALERKSQSSPTKIALWSAGIVLAVPGILFAAYYTHLFDNAAWFYNLRTLPYSELAGCGVGFLAGLVHSWWQPETLGEKSVCPTVLFLVILIPFAKPLLDPLDLSQLRDRSDGGIYLQSTFSTCGPASAATLVRSFGQVATERQLAQESFTSRGGTEIWYLSRALRRRGINTAVVIHQSDDPLLPSPAIAGVLLPGHAGHFIAVLKNDGNEVTIADPLKGKLVIARSELSQYYHFTGFFLVLPRPGPNSPA